MARSFRHLALILGILAFIGAACGSSSNVDVPSWLRDKALSLKAQLGDSEARISYVLGSYPIAIVHGHLTCGGGSCLGPVPYARKGTIPSVTGSTAAERYDGHTHRRTIFTVSKHGVEETVRSLCQGFGPLCASGGPDS
jgi:hypothetical protein